MVDSESSQNNLTSGDWMLSESRTTSSRRGDLMVLGTAKLRHRKSMLWPTMRGGDVSKRNLKEFTIASNEIQHIVIRNSKLAVHRNGQIGTGRPLVSHTEQIGQECTDETSITLPNVSHTNEPSPPCKDNTSNDPFSRCKSVQ